MPALTWVQQFGQTQDPRTYAFHRQVNQRIAYLKSYCGGARAATYYVSESTGNDSNPGTEAAPWQSLAKINSFIAANPSGNYAILMKRGDIWYDTLNSGYLINAPNVTLADYGTGPRPQVSRFINSLATGAFTLVSGTLWKWAPPAGDGVAGFRVRGTSTSITGAFNGAFKQFNYQIDANKYPFDVGTSSADVASYVGKMYFDSAGTDPNSGGVPTFYFNPGTSSYWGGTMEWVPTSSGYSNIWLDGAADAVLVQNIAIHGSGLYKNIGGDGYIGYNIQCSQNGAAAAVWVDGCECFWGGFHNIGLATPAQGGIALFTRNEVGYSYANTGNFSNFVGFAPDGSQELYCDDNFVVCGAIPPAFTGDPATQAYTSNNATLISHATGAYTVGMIIDRNTTASACTHHPAGTPGIGANFAATTPSQATGFIIGFKMDPVPWPYTENLRATNMGIFASAGIVDINSHYRFTSPSASPATLSTGTVGVSWAINCTYEVQSLAGSNWIFTNDTLNCFLWHCRFSGNIQTLLYGTPTVQQPGQIANCDFSQVDQTSLSLASGGLEYYDFSNNCYPALQTTFGSDPAPQVQHNPHGVNYTPQPGDELYQNGVQLGLEYDANMQPRLGTPSIGPLETPTAYLTPAGAIL